MGTVNYGTSDYITIGYEPISSYELEKDSSFMEELKAEIGEYGGTLEEAVQDYISSWEEVAFSQVKNILDKYDFKFFNVELKYGYYEGFYIDIYYDDDSDQQAALQEITQIEAFLIECVEEGGLCQVFPGWCTAYDDYETSIQAIKEAAKEMRLEVNATPDTTSVTIPDSVARMIEWAFAYCENFASITIPDSVVNVGNGAFMDCISLEAV